MRILPIRRRNRARSAASAAIAGSEGFLAHGIANALLLPVVMEYNGEVCYERFREILTALGEDAKNDSKEEVIHNIKHKVFEEI